MKKGVKSDAKFERLRKVYNNYIYARNKEQGQGLHRRVYWKCLKKPCKGRLVEFPLGTFTETEVEHICAYNVVEQAKDAALAKLKELTLSSESVKAIEIVRKVLKEMPPEARHLMPTEDSLRRRVTRWAQQAGIEVVRLTADDYVRNSESLALQNPEESILEQSTDGNNQNSSLGGNKSSCPSTSLINIKTEIEIDEENIEELENGLKILRDKKINGRYRIMIKNQIYNWKRDYTGRALYSCREARIGCPVTATVYQDDNRYEVKGKHKHDRPLINPAKPKRYKKKRYTGIKLVDDQGNQIGIVNSIDDVPPTGHDGSNITDASQWFNPPTSTGIKEPARATDVEGPEDDGDDFVADFDPIDPIDDAEYTSLNESNVKTAKKPPKDAAKSGERCYVCGDELLVSETLASSQETFRKACCYLNVKSKSEWFPGMDGSRFYSFCESCTNEITRIHQLYRKVDEIQSLIFKKVEDVEKRIADAEIVDNWMADAPQSSALRFEGFRQQVLINYRNKLKVRREVRIGKKMGHNFVEIQPMRSAHMFATDPAATNAFSKLAPSDNPEEAVELENSQVEEPRRHSKRSKSQHNTTFDSPQMDDADDHIGFDDSQDEWCGEEPEKETKFWKDDPSKLNVGNMSTNEDSHDADAGDDFMEGGDDANVESDSDASLNDSDDDEDWESDQKKKNKTKNQAGNSNLNQSKQKETPSKPTYCKDKEYRFPDTIVTKDNRLYMEGVEIIKLPAGSYSRMPFNEVFMCGACDKMMVSFWKIRQHICGHHLGMYKCSICGKEFAEPRLIPQHIERKHKERKPTECEICGRPMFARTPEAMRYHIYTHLGVEEKKDPKYANYCPPHKKDPNRPKRILAKNFQTFQCFQCGKTFLRPSALKRHELIHGGDALKVQCQHCGKMYAHRKALSDHLNICSLNTNVNRQTYPCPKCPQRFKNRSTRSKHLKNHDKPSPFSCPKCPRKFSSKNGFKNHKRICTETTTRYGGTINNVRTEHSAFESNVRESSPIASTSSSEYPTEVKASTSQQSLSYYQDAMGTLQYPMGFNIHHSGGH